MFGEIRSLRFPGNGTGHARLLAGKSSTHWAFRYVETTDFDCHRVEGTSLRAGVATAEVQRLARRTFSPTAGKPFTVEFLNYNEVRCCNMDAALKIVTHLPLRELWRDDGLNTTARIRSLTEDDIRSLLRSGNIQFVVVNVGASPCWIRPSECFQFWRNEAQPHLARRQG